MLTISQCIRIFNNFSTAQKKLQVMHLSLESEVQWFAPVATYIGQTAGNNYVHHIGQAVCPSYKITLFQQFISDTTHKYIIPKVCLRQHTVPCSNIVPQLNI
jgi:hypothetical protein